MSPELLRVMLGLFSVWGVAVSIKALVALNRRQPYVFSLWDGGMLRAGRRLNRLGTQVKLFAGFGIAAYCIVVVTGVLHSMTAYWIAIGALALVLISDYVNSES